MEPFFQRGNIMSDPGFLKAILTPSEQWATNMIDLNENWLFGSAIDLL